MGWASRARESEDELATDQRELPRWKVTQWTDFPWRDDADKSARKDREENLERFAKQLTMAMVGKCARFEPSCKQVQVDGAPQLTFEMTVPANTREEAAVRLMYWVKRVAATTRTVKHRGRVVRSPVGLHFPLGKVEVTSV